MKFNNGIITCDSCGAIITDDKTENLRRHPVYGYICPKCKAEYTKKVINLVRGLNKNEKNS